MEEHIFYTSCSTTNQLSTGSGTGVGDLVITQANLHTGSQISSFKQSSSPKHGLQVTQCHIFANQSQKSLLHIYSHDKEGVEQKIVLPEKLSCIQISPNGTWLAGGGFSGRLLLWELKSGNLLYARSTHYQEITCIEFTQDESCIITGSKDSRVQVWNIVDLVDLMMLSDEVKPMVTWSHHTLEVTGLYVGYGNSYDCRVFTSSADSTIRSYDLRTKSLLTTYSLPEPVVALTVDPLERVIYAGLASGKIRMLSLYEAGQSGHIEVQGGAQRIVTVPAESDAFLRQHEAAITCMKVSLDGNILVSGDANGHIFSWDVLTKQVLRKFRPHRGSISGISVISRLKPLANEPKKQIVHIPVLKRVLEPLEATQHNLWMQISPESDKTARRDRNGNLELLRRQSAQLLGESNDSLQLRVNELEGELETLHSNYLKLKTVHEDLWKVHVARA